MFNFRYPAVVLLACTVAGTLLGRELNPGLPLIVIAVVLAAGFLPYGFLRLPRHYFVIPLALLTISVTLLNAGKTYQSFPADDIGRYVGNDQRLRFFGEIVKWPLIKQHRTILVCQVDSVAVENSVEDASGAIMLRINRVTTHFSLGDQVCFSGHLRRPFSGGYPGQFDYARYLKSKGIRGTVSIRDPVHIWTLKRQHNFFGKTINIIRKWILQCFRTNLTELPAALASGFLIGETRDIPDGVYSSFRRTGTMHLLAVSGSNVALVLLVMVYLIRFFHINRLTRLVLLLVVIVVFAHLSYNQPSVVRASIMAALILVARVFYRRADLHNIIATAATILIFYDPGNLFDIGFQLSFAVTWALVLFLPHINRSIVDRKMKRPVRYLLLIVFSSLIATLISAPITAYYFGEISLVTVFSNLVIVPLVSASVIGIVVLLLAEFAFPGAGIFPGMLMDRLLGLINELVLWFGKWKFAAATTSSFPAAYVYIFLAGVTIAMLAINNRFMRRVLALFVVIVGLYVLTSAVFTSSPKFSDIEVYNMGTTQTVIINRGDGIVIFWGQRRSGRDSFSADLLPYLKRRNRPFPGYFVFMEPRYRTEYRLDNIAGTGSGSDFWPLVKNSENGEPTVWTSYPPYSDISNDSGFSFHPSDGAIIIRFPDSAGVLFAEDVANLDKYSTSDLSQLHYYFAIINDETELAGLEQSIDLSKVVLMPRQALVSHYVSSPEAAGGSFYPEIIQVGGGVAYLTLPCAERKQSL